MTIRQYNNKTIWQLDNMTKRLHDNKTIWQQDNMTRRQEVNMKARQYGNQDNMSIIDKKLTPPPPRSILSLSVFLHIAGPLSYIPF